jgi:hypothetical protein
MGKKANQERLELWHSELRTQGALADALHIGAELRQACREQVKRWEALEAQMDAEFAAMRGIQNSRIANSKHE